MVWVLVTPICGIPDRKPKHKCYRFLVHIGFRSTRVHFLKSCERNFAMADKQVFVVHACIVCGSVLIFLIFILFCLGFFFVPLLASVINVFDKFFLIFGFRNLRREMLYARKAYLRGREQLKACSRTVSHRDIKQPPIHPSICLPR